MSANRDAPEKRYGHAGVHTNPANNQPVTSTSIHGRNTAGNHGGYSNTEKYTSGQNRDMYMGNTPLGIGRGRPSQRDDTRNTIQTGDGAKEANIDDIGNRDKSFISGSMIQTCSFKTSQGGSDSSSDTDTSVAPDCSDTATYSLSQQEKLDESVMSKGQCGQVTDQEKLDRSIFSKDDTDVKPDQGAIPKNKSAVIELDPLLIQLLKLQDIKTFIEKLCEKQDLKVTWTLSELNSTITCYCKDKKAVQDFRDVLYHNLKKKTYSMCYGSEKSAFSECIKEYTGKCLVSTHDEDNFHIFTTRNIVEKLARLEVTFKDTKIDIQKKFTTKQNVAAWQLGNGSFNQQTFGEENLRKSTKADKLGTTLKHGDLDDCVICMEPPTLPRKLHCDQPTCGSIQEVVTGDQPPGTMKVRTSGLPLPGHHHCGRIEIEYVIHSGKQTAEHPNEGRWYERITRIAYLPDNKQGKKIAKLLRVAFDRKLIFTIGHSRTTGKQGVVTWNDIHHKTTRNPGKQFGYPDDTYFDRVLDELRIKGVTEKDL